MRNTGLLFICLFMVKSIIQISSLLKKIIQITTKGKGCLLLSKTIHPGQYRGLKPCRGDSLITRSKDTDGSQ
jgi:hypothetical protein